MDDQKDKSILNSSRRDFLKNTAITAAGFMIVPAPCIGRKRFYSSQRQVDNCEYRCWWKRSKVILLIFIQAVKLILLFYVMWIHEGLQLP